MDTYSRLASTLKRVVDLSVTGFGLGYLPKAPGTWGTLGGLPLILLLKLSDFIHVGGPWLLYLMATVVGMLAVSLYEKDHGHHDAPEIVIDEILGFTLIYLVVPLSFTSLIAGFVIFRLFDIFKPQPISWIENSLKGGPLGTVLDDLVAGVLAAIAVLIGQLIWGLL